MEVNGQLRAPGALPPGKAPQLPTGWEDLVGPSHCERYDDQKILLSLMRIEAQS